VVPLAEALSFLPKRELDAEDAQRVTHGATPAGGVTPLQAGDSAVRLTYGARVLAIAEPREGRMKPLVVFPA
jgi:hypothetical protein